MIWTLTQTISRHIRRNNAIKLTGSLDSDWNQVGVKFKFTFTSEPGLRVIPSTSRTLAKS